MRFEEFNINGYCAIEHVKLELNDNKIISIVGQNESGKTSLLRAIAWWGGDPDIEITEDDLLGDDTEIHQSEEPIVEVKVKVNLNEFKHLNPDFHSNLFITEELEPLSKEIQENFISVCRYLDGSRRCIISSEEDESTESIEIEEEEFESVFPRFIYYNIFNEYIEEDNVLWAQFLTQKGWKNVARVLNIDEDKHEEITLLFSETNLFRLKKYEDELTGILTNKFQVFWEGTPKNLRISLNMNRIGVTCVDLDDNGNIVAYRKPSQMSSGFRWAFCINTKLEALTKEDPEKALFLLLDEPSTSLSGDQQKKLMDSFTIFCEKRNYIIFATHSPFMIDLEKRIQVMESRDGKSTLHNLENLQGKELLITLRARLNLTLADSLFYGKQLLIVEGITDRGHLNLILGDQLDKNLVSIIETDGTSQLIVKLDELEREGLLQYCSIALDSDEAGISSKRKAKKHIKEKEISIPIRTLRGEDIEDYFSRSDFIRICNGFLDEENCSSLEDYFSSLLQKKFERGRTKKVISILNYEPGVFKLRFLAKARENGIEKLEEETIKNFNYILVKLKIN